MKHIYLISGLGADERVFSYLQFNNYIIHHIKWITPANDESLFDYATRISSQIQYKKPIIIGVSFGGIIAVELSNIIPYDKIIILSSAKNSAELPYYYKLAGVLKLYKLIPQSTLNWYNCILSYLFGIETPEEKVLLKAIIEDTNVVFAKWAIYRILTWNFLNCNASNLYHIHGSLDRLIPLRNIKNCIEVKNGSHFMIVNKSKHINIIINELLSPG